MKKGMLAGKRLLAAVLVLWCLLLGAGSVSAEEAWSPYPVSSPADVLTQLRNNNGLQISKEIWKEGNTVVIQSDKKVQYADGTVDYMSMAFAHDNNVSDLKVGMHLSQGQVFYQTGEYGNAQGVHSHVTCIKGKFKNNLWAKKSKQGNSYCPNQIHPVNALFLGNAKVINAKGLKFKK